MAYMNPRLILLALWTCLAGILPVSAQQSDTRVALLIGNAAYPDAEAPLRDPVNNVRSLADELRSQSVRVRNFIADRHWLFGRTPQGVPANPFVERACNLNKASRA